LNYLSKNPAIFTYDYEIIKESRKEINKEIVEESMKRIYRPDKLFKSNVDELDDLEKDIDYYIKQYGH
jgi:hypothetical protein